MKRLVVLGLLAVLALAACQPNYQIATVTPVPEVTEVSVLPSETPVPPPTETPIPPTDVPPTDIPPTPEPPPVEALPTAEPVVAGPLPIMQGEFFTTSGQCAICHIRNVDQAGNDVAFDSQWRSSMMANAARDPYWQAGVRNEVLMNPGYADFIEDKCTTCHMPMARFTHYAYDEQARLLDESGLLNPEDDLHVMALDGVSCTLCHQIEPTNFGEVKSFSGHYEIDTTLPTGERHAYGPFEVSEANMLVMQSSSGFIPQLGIHVQESELCGTCHTLFTPTINGQGETVGEFAEQMVYPEWAFSAFAAEQSCQDCHMPPADGGVILSVTGGELREPYMQHIFVGANFYMPDLLRRNRGELGYSAGDDHTDAKIAAVMDQLQNQSATLAVENATVSDGQLTADVVVTSLVGHKFPTSYPARRTWLHVTVTDAAGNAVFESGAFNPDGSITGNDNDADAALYEPHYEAVTSPEEVQIYEAIMGNTDNVPTTTLLRGAGYLKDNRLLPDGFDKDAAEEAIQVWGAAQDDTDFVGGSDVVRYEIALGEAKGPFTLQVEMLYQSIAYRWAHNLEQHDSFETNRFLDYYNDYPSPAAVVTSTSAVIP